MNKSQVCPECRAELPVDAPGGLCPRCLMDAVVGVSQTVVAYGSAGPVEDRGAALEPATLVDLDQFKRAILGLGLIRGADFERIAAGATGGVSGLAGALVKAGKLTPHQAEALSNGKAKELVIGNYFILDKLGAGGMGAVFKARHRRLGRVVALKVLLPSLASEPELLLRFRREVDVAARLSHPNVVSVLDADEDRGVQFMTMEYIPGNDLDHLVRDNGVLPIDLALDCVIQAARGLEAVHQQGIVHRDIKPSNLMLDGSGVVRVLDLGLARLVEAAHPFGETVTGPQTLAGMYMGTVDFMAPEQGVDSRAVDHRADIYSLGCTLCYLLTGRAPFEGANILSRLVAHQGQAPSSLPAWRPDIPRSIDAAYQKMMAKKPTDRPASMREVIKLLEACRSSTFEADEARSGLKRFATTVIHNQAPVKATVLGASAVSPRRRKRVGLAFVALATLAIGVLVYQSMVPPEIGKPLIVGDTGPISDQSSDVEPGPETLAPEPPPEARSSGIFDVSTLFTLLGEDNRPGSVETIAVTADGRRALVGSWTEYVMLVNVDTGTKARPILGSHNGWQGGRPTVAMTPDGRRALVGTQTVLKENLKRIKAKEAGILWFWDLKTGKELFPKQQPYKGSITSVAISNDGLRGLSASKEGELTLWDLTTGQSRSLGSQEGSVSSGGMAFFPDGRRAATAGQDRLVHIWDLDTLEELAVWKGHAKTLSGLAISADGQRVVTGSYDGTVILWDVAKNQLLHRFEMPPDDKGARVVFDSNGNIVAAGNGMGGKDPKPGHLIVWDARTYATLRSERPFASHLAVAALPGGGLLTGDRHALRLWTVSKVDLLGLIKPETYQVGTWQSVGGELISPTAHGSRLQFPYAPPAEYRIDMEVERIGKDGGYGFGLGFVVGGRLTEITVDKSVGTEIWTGINGLDGIPVETNPDHHRGPILNLSRPSRFSLTVRRHSITLTCDGSKVVDWSGDPERLIPFQRWNVPDPKAPFLATSCMVKFRKMTLTPLTAAKP